jgi:acetate---CoA ligase (ADP-forming)
MLRDIAAEAQPATTPVLSLLRPASIAVLGATARHFAGSISMLNCQTLSYAGRITPISRTRQVVGGLPTVRTLSELDHVPDVALVLLNPQAAMEAVGEALALGIRGLVIPGGGITDSGDAAHELNACVRTLAKRYGAHVAGPNSMGIVDLVSGSAPYIGTVPASVRRGPVAVLSHSGAVVEAFIGAGGRVPLSTAVSMGSEVATTTADFIDAFTDDPETTAVLAFLEGLGDGEALLASVRRLTSSGKHLAVVLVGRSSVARAGISAHSGKLAPSHRTACAALRQAGAIVVDDLDELIAVGEILGTGRRIEGKSLHLVTNSGGQANMMADIIEDTGLELPMMSPAAVGSLSQRWPAFHVANPLDPWGVDDYQNVYPQALRAAAAEQGDVLVMSIDQQSTSGRHEKTLGTDLARMLADATSDSTVTPVFLSPVSQDPPRDLVTLCRQQRVPLLRGARSALRAIDALADAAARRPVATAATPQDPARVQLPEHLDEVTALTVLAALDVPVPQMVRIGDAAGAVEAAERIGYPVVLKAVAPELTHKSEHRLVRVGLTDGAHVRRAAEEVAGTLESLGIGGQLVVAEQVQGELEIYVGLVRDADVGPAVVLGLGGIWAEALDVADVHVGPVTGWAAWDFVRASRVGVLAGAARGGALDLAGVVAAVRAVSELAADPEVLAVDINPLVVSRDRATAVDAVIQRRQLDHPAAVT